MRAGDRNVPKGEKLQTALSELLSREVREKLIQVVQSKPTESPPDAEKAAAPTLRSATG